MAPSLKVSQFQVRLMKEVRSFIHQNGGTPEEAAQAMMLVLADLSTEEETVASMIERLANKKTRSR
jgi:predicted Zn-dependent peptidase